MLEYCNEYTVQLYARISLCKKCNAVVISCVAALVDIVDLHAGSTEARCWYSPKNGIKLGIATRK